MEKDGIHPMNFQIKYEQMQRMKKWKLHWYNSYTSRGTIYLIQAKIGGFFINLFICFENWEYYDYIQFWLSTATQTEKCYYYTYSHDIIAQEMLCEEFTLMFQITGWKEQFQRNHLDSNYFSIKKLDVA